jgi:D-alanine-D-alanine ligase
LRYDDTVVVEEAVEGREIGVAVIGNAAHRVSAPCEIVPSREFYDFEDKYLARGSTFHVPASLGETETETVRQLAGRAYAALRMNGMARVDFFYEERGRGFLVNEINAIPGFRSVFPGMWEASGLSRTALIDELVRLAVERWVRRERFEISRHHA